MKKVYIVSHTHWDSEWYELYEAWKLHLVSLMNEALHILERDPKFKFHLDGQVSPAVEYLEILEEADPKLARRRAAMIRRFVEQGRLTIGPLWNTPEESLISLEALIRNLARGIRFSERLGGAGTVYWNVDSFQHHSQVPQVLNGFGLKNAAVWRGMLELAEFTDTNWWQSPDGSKVLLHYLAKSYALMWKLPKQIKYAHEFLRRESGILSALSPIDTALITHGNDQTHPQKDTTKIIARVNAMADGFQVKLVTPAEFMRLYKKAKDLDTMIGELTGNRYGPTLSGQVSARMYLKQMDNAAEVMLEKLAEPAAVFAHMLGEPHPTGMLERAWLFAMRNHFHTCNACGSDAVHLEGETRYRNVLRIGTLVKEEALAQVAKRVDTSALTRDEDGLVIYNPASKPRTGVIEIEVDMNKKAYFGPSPWWIDEDKELPGVELSDYSGRPVPYQLMRRVGNVFRLAVMPGEIPPFGYITYRLKKGVAVSPAGSIASGNVLENEYLRVTVNTDGSVAVLDKDSGILHTGLNIFTDGGDAGDTYNYSAPETDLLVSSAGAKGKVSVTANGPYLGTVRVKLLLLVPEKLAPGRSKRSSFPTKLEVVTHVTLHKGSRLVHFRTAVNNRALDHRLRVSFEAPKVDQVFAETQGDVVYRAFGAPLYEKDELRETLSKVQVGRLPLETGPSKTHFQRGFVGAHDGETGVVVFNKGLPEYEAEAGKLNLTLLRSVGWLARNDVPVRQLGTAGPELEAPGAQCPGEHEFEYAVMPLSEEPPQTDMAELCNVSENYRLPFEAVRVPKQKGKLPQCLSFLAVYPSALQVMAVKKAFKGDALVLRVINMSDRAEDACFRFMKPAKSVYETDLYEKNLRKLTPFEEGTVAFRIGPKEIKTFKVRL